MLTLVKSLVVGHPGSNKAEMMKSGSVVLALLLFLAEAFRPTQQASVNSSNVPTTSASNTVSTLKEAAPVTCANMDTESSCFITESYVDFMSIVTDPAENFEKYFANVPASRHNSCNNCLKFIESQKESFQVVIETIQKDYHAIKRLEASWTSVASNLVLWLKSLSPDRVREIGAEEALNCTIIIMAFGTGGTGGTTLFDRWMGIEMLGSCFAPNHWADFADWAIYVARPDVFTLPPQLFRPSLFSHAQRIAMTQTIFEVVIAQKSFEKDHFHQPPWESRDSDTLDLNYVFVPVRNCDINRKTVEKLGLPIEYFIACVQSMENICTTTLVDATQWLCEILTFLRENTHLWLLAIIALSSGSVLQRLKGILNQSTGKDYAQKLIAVAHDADEEFFNICVKNLDLTTKALVVSYVVAHKRDSEPNSLFVEVSEKLKSILPFLHELAPSEVETVLAIINAAFKAVKSLPFPELSPDMKIKESFFPLYKQAQSVQLLEHYLCQNLTTTLIAPETIAVYSPEAMYLACNIGRGLMELALIQYLLSNTRQKVQTGSEVLFAIGRFAQLSISHTDRFGSYMNHADLQAHRRLVSITIEKCMPMEDIIQLYLRVSPQIIDKNPFPTNKLFNMLALIRIIFNDDSTGDFARQAALLFEAFILRGGMHSRMHLRTSYFLTLPTRTSVCLSAVSKLHSDPLRKTEDDRAALKALVRWLIENNHVPRSVAMVLGAALG
jgi:hypothetical protein